jgi:hypothetical protein
MTTTLPLTDELKARIQALPFADRVCLLITSIIARDSEAIRAMFGLMDLLLRMSQSFDADNRVRIAEALRNIADRIERERLTLSLVATLLNEKRISKQ